MKYQEQFQELLKRPIVAAAYEYAKQEHERVEQTRKYLETPYIYHPMQAAVYVSLSIHGASDRAIATAILHDVLEDTLDKEKAETVEAGAERMRAHFERVLDAEIAEDLVRRTLQVTDVSVPTDGNRAKRKGIDRDHAAKADAEQQTVKLADIKSNFPSIVLNDPGFAKRWVPEKKEVAALMTKGDPVLRAEVLGMIERWEKRTFTGEGYEIV